jgi:hypothetical protein
VLSLSQTIDRVQNKTASFDIADFTPITAIASNPAGLLVNSRMARTMAGSSRRFGQTPPSLWQR